MIYTEADFERMETDPEFRRQYVWQVGQAALLRSHHIRARGDLIEAQDQAMFGRLVLDNLDLIAG